MATALQLLTDSLREDTDPESPFYKSKDEAIRLDVTPRSRGISTPEPADTVPSQPRSALQATRPAEPPQPKPEPQRFNLDELMGGAASVTGSSGEPAKETDRKQTFSLNELMGTPAETQTPTAPKKVEEPGMLERTGKAVDDAITSVLGQNKASDSQIDKEGLERFKAEEAEQLARVAKRRAELGTDKDRGTAMRLFDSAASGFGSAISGTLEWLGDTVGSKAISELGRKGKEEAMALTPQDQNVLEKVSGAAGSMLSFFAPGAGVVKGLQVLGTGVKTARTVGIGTAAVLESAGVAQEAYEKAMSETGNEQLARERAWAAGAVNLPLTYFTNKLGLFGETGSAAKKIGTTFLTEGAQEGSQNILTNVAGFKPSGEGVSEATVIGGIAGGGFKGGQLALERYFKEQTPEQQKKLVDDLIEDGAAARQQIFDQMIQDPRTADILRGAGIESADDPRFQGIAIQIGKLDREISSFDIPTAEEREQRRKERGEDVQAAFGDTASTAIGSNTGATEPLIRRDSVTPNEETKTLEGDAKPVILPDTDTTKAGTPAMSGEDLVAKQEGYEVLPAFSTQQPNRFVTRQQAETFLFGPLNKKTGQREGGYASSVADMEFGIRQGKRSKAEGGGTFFFVEGRQRKPEANRTVPSTTVNPPQPGGQTQSSAPTGSQPTANPPVTDDLVDRGDGVMVPRSSLPKIEDIDRKANEAATSPLNSLPQPSDGQKAAGNYKKGEVKILGLDIAIENPRGSERSGTDASGKAWRQNMAHHYGYVRGSKGKDGDQVDVFIGPNPDSQTVWVVDQVNPDGTFDEHKALIGFNSEAEARAGYLANYESGWTGLGSITAMPVDAFRSWVRDGKKRKPLALPAPRTQQTETQTQTQEPQATEQSAPQTESKAEPQPKKGSAGDRMRAKLRAENPFRAFLGKHGVSLSVASEFAPGPKERRAAMASGYGPIFRKTGLQLDDLAVRAAEGGFVPRSVMEDGDTTMLYEMIDRSLRGEKIFPMYGQDADSIIEQQFAEAQRQELEDSETQQTVDPEADEYAIAEREAIQAVDSLTDAELFEVDDAIDFNGPGNVDTRRAMMALGFSEEEINEAIAKEQAQSESAGGNDQAGQAQAERPSEDPQASDGEARAGDSVEGEVTEDKPEVDPKKLAKLKERINTAYEDGALDLADVLDLEKMGESGDLMGAVREMNRIARSNKGYKASYRVTTVDDTGMTKDAVERVVEAVTGKWTNLPKIKVLASEDDLPIRQLRRIKNAGMDGKVPGLYYKGEVILIAGNIHNNADAVLTIAHEVAGHFGLRSIYGDQFAKKMREIYDSNVTVRKQADAMKVKEDLSIEEATEEVLADMAERGDDLKPDERSALRRVIDFVRKFFAKIGVGRFVSDAEIKNIVGNARRFVMFGDVKTEGEGGATAADATTARQRAASRAKGVATFYSALERAFRGNKMERMPAQQWKSWLASNGPKLGVKKEEIEWVGINEWLDLKGNEKVSKQEVLDFIAGNRVYVNEVVLTAGKSRMDDSELYELVEQIGEDPFNMSRDEMVELVSRYYGWKRKAVGETKHRDKWTLPGGDDSTYTELILTDPTIDPYKPTDATHFGDVSDGRALGWLRMIVRKDAAGNDVLFLEELQSQRGQDGRKDGFKPRNANKRLKEIEDRLFDRGTRINKINERMAALTDGEMDEFNRLADERAELYREQDKDNGAYQKLADENSVPVPLAPFVGETTTWTSLLLKRAIAYAQANGIDRIAWTTGEQQVDRYKLSKRIDSLAYVKDKKTGQVTIAGEKDGKQLFEKVLDKKKLAGEVGKEMADQIEQNKGMEIDNEFETSGVISGVDLDVGGNGVALYYNQTVPSVAKQVLKGLGGGNVDVMEIEDTGQQLGFVLTPKMQQMVEEDGVPMFRRRDYESQFDDLSPKAKAMALAKGFVSPPTIKERLDSLRPQMWLRVVQGTFDKFRRVRDLDTKAYIQLRLSSGPQDGAVAGLVHYGQVFNDDGALNLKKGTKGLLEVMKPLGGETDRFLLWVAANRAGELKKQERERFFKDDEIAELKRLNLGTTKDGKSRAATYAQVLQGMNELNRSVLDVARSTGLIDEAAYKRFASDIWYVPFYRQMDEDGTLSAAQTSSGAVGQYLSKRLKGSERPLNDLMENVLMNWSHILSAGMKNQAANTTLDSAVQMQIASKIKKLDDRFGQDADGNKIPLKYAVKTMVNGKEQYWNIEDDFLFESLDAVANMPSYGFFMNTAREFKTMLTRFVSLSPTFKINNLIRDSVQSIGLTELKKNPVANVIEGWRAWDDNHAEALVGGGLFALGNAFDGDRAANVKRLIKKGVPADQILNTEEKVKNFFKKAWDKYDDVSDKMENANRLALYNQLREKGASHMEAAYAARDLQDFSLQGSWTAIRYLSQVLPYFNARLQGMYKLGRDGLDPVVQVLSGNATESERQKAMKFGTVLGAVTLFGTLLYLSQKDDEDYKKLEDWERDTFFWFKIPGTEMAIRIPKPFEMGAFQTIVERFTEQIVDDSVEGKVFGKRLLAVLADNLAINPIPQIVRPIYDIARNKDGFTDRPIESMAMERLSAENRVNPNTSSVAVAMGTINSMFANMAESVTGGAVNAQNLQLSPIQYDYLLRGYFGWVGTAIQTTANVATAPFKPGESSRFERIDDFLVVGNFIKTMPQPNSKFVTGFYENAQAAARATADMQFYINAGQIDRAVQMMDEKSDILALNKLYTKAQKSMSEIQKQIKATEADEFMTGAEKRLQIEALQQLRIDYAKAVEEARVAAKGK